MILTRFICMQKRENTGIKYLNNLKPFIECLNTMDSVYEDIDG